MALFNKAIVTVLKHEGNFVNDPDDPGGATNFGISLRFIHQNLPQSLKDMIDLDDDGVISVEEIRNMKVEVARNIYLVCWWEKYQYAQIENQDLATKVFDLAVNMGAPQAHKLLQRAIRASGVYLVDDGILGPKTFAAIDCLNALGSDDAILSGLRSEAAGFYRLLIAKKPTLQKFEKGWLSRAYA